MSLRMALIDDQDLIGEGLQALPERSDIAVVLSARDGIELLEQISSMSADVILADIRMPGLDGIALVRELRTRGNQTPVVVRTTFEESDLLLAAVEAGAQGFLLKGATSEELGAAPDRPRRGAR